LATPNKSSLLMEPAQFPPLEKSSIHRKSLGSFPSTRQLPAVLRSFACVAGSQSIWEVNTLAQVFKPGKLSWWNTKEASIKD
jgi:hypothetical protein